MGIKILEAEARAIDELCELLFQKFDSDKELSSSEAAKKKQIITDFVRTILDNFEITKEMPDLDFRTIINNWHAKLGTDSSPFITFTYNVGRLTDSYIVNTDTLKINTSANGITINTTSTGPY